MKKYERLQQKHLKKIKVEIENVVSYDRLHLFAVIPPNIAVSDFIKKAKGSRRSLRKVKQEFSRAKKNILRNVF